MEITIAKAELARALYLTQSIVERKTTMPILANVLISAADRKVKFSATDLEITAVATVPAEVRSPGSTTVNAKVFGDIVRELPEGDVTLRLTEGHRIEVTARTSKVRINGVTADEYPSLPGVGFAPKTKFSSAQLLEMIEKTLYAVSLDETRYNLNGVCFELVPGKGKKDGRSLRMVATDGHRLALITRPVGDMELPEQSIVPRKGLTEIKKFLDAGSDKPVTMDFHNGFLVVESGDAKVAMRLIDGEFPDYNQVLPQKKGVDAVINSAEFAQALRRVALMVTDKGKCVKLDFAKNKLRISSSSPELGEANEELEVKYPGAPLSIGFNARYLLDIASSLQENQPLTIELHGELGPGRFFPEGDESYTAIVMPMRLS